MLQLMIGALSLCFFASFSLASQESKVLKELKYQNELIQIRGKISPLTDVEGIQIDALVVSYKGYNYYLGDKYPYAQVTHRLVCEIFGYSYSRPQFKGAWFWQSGIYFDYDKGILTENLSNSSYVQTLYCAHQRIPE